MFQTCAFSLDRTQLLDANLSLETWSKNKTLLAGRHVKTNVKVAVEAKQCKLVLQMNSVVDVFNRMNSDVDKLHTRHLQWHQQSELMADDTS